MGFNRLYLCSIFSVRWIYNEQNSLLIQHSMNEHSFKHYRGKFWKTKASKFKSKLLLCYKKNPKHNARVIYECLLHNIQEDGFTIPKLLI